MKKIAVGFAILFLSVSAIALFKLSKSRDVQLFGRLVDRVDTNEKVVALTFDDGPVPAATEKILAELAQAQVPATFFLTGKAIEQHPEAAKQLIAAGHQIGNHSYSHQRMVFMSYQKIADEISKTNEFIRALGYDKKILFRPPYGKKLLMLPLYLQRHNITSITWDIEPESIPDISTDSEKIAEYVAQQVKPGSIILLHVMFPARQASMDAVPGIVSKLKKQGYRFVTVDELLKFQP